MKEIGKIKFVPKEKTNFFFTLRTRVDNYFRENNISKNADSSMVVKTLVLLIVYLVPFILILTAGFPWWGNMLLWALSGLGMAGIGMCVMHDANHGAYSSNRYVTMILSHTLNLLGGSVFNWKLQHNVLHHTYTNIVDMDEDIDDKLILRFSPHTKVKPIQKLQVVYAFILYGILTFYWVTAKDLVQFIKYTGNKVNTNSQKQNIITVLKISLGKIIYFFLVLFVPVYFCHLSFLQVFTGFMLMHFLAGLILTVVFQLAHTVEGTSHPLPDENGVIDNDWSIHQMNTTVNFSRKNKFISWYVGGLNFQVEHHLFPRICHVHYPEIAHIVKQTAEEYGVPYLENQTLAEALKSHVITLRRFGG
ncbi:MAG: fatty acid desaturase family protein [Bacteroidia bacterium]